MSTDKISNNDISARSLEMSRVLNAPRELVWNVWTDPEHIKNWWGPNDFTNTISKMDVEPEGVWDLIMHGPDGTNYINKSVFREIVKYERIVLDHVSSPKFRATITFTQEGEKTRINWQMLFATAGELEQVVKVFKADEGLKQNLDKLETYLANFSEKK